MSSKESSKPKKNKDYTAIRALAESDSTELNVRPYLEEWARLHYPKSWSPNGSPDPIGAVPEMDSDWGGNAWEDLEESLPWKNPETPQGDLIGLLPSKMYYPSAREAALKDFLGHLNLKQGAAVNTYSAYLTKESSIKVANNLNLLLTKMAYGVSDTYSEIKVANNLMSLVVKQAAPPVDPMDAEFDRQEARQEALDKQMQAANLVNKGPQQVRGGALIKPDGKAVDPARQAQVDAANNARKAIGMTAPAVVKPVAPVVKPVAPVVKPVAPVVKPVAPVVKPIAPVVEPKGVPSGQGGAGVDEG